MESNITKNDKKKIIVVAIFIILITLIGGTLAYIVFGMNFTNHTYTDYAECFDIDYSILNDDDTSSIAGTLFPSIDYSGGLYGKVSLNINEKCNITGLGEINLHVDTKYKLVSYSPRHCENPNTLETITDYTTQSTCESAGYSWVVGGSAIKYAVVSNEGIESVGDILTDKVYTEDKELLGDANSDGKVDNSDYQLLSNYIRGGEVVINENVVDLDENGLINATDSTILLRFVNKNEGLRVNNDVSFDTTVYSDFMVDNTKRDYTIYIWMDGELADNSYASIPFGGEISAKVVQVENGSSGYYSEEILNGADPVLASGMIPVTIADDGTVSTANTTQEWYNYTDKEWANAVLVKSTGTTNSRTYYEEKVANNEVVTIPEDDILAYYVWIPKYSYQMNETEEAISISFNSTPSGYIDHPAFTFESNQLGMWVGKFETGHTSSMSCTDEDCAKADSLIIKPNVQALRYNKVSSFFYGARSMERSENPFGLISSEVDTHMMKNSEWGAVAYLSHSVYGINGEIYINNSLGYYTGRSGGNVGGSQNALATQFNDSSLSTSINYNRYGYYTWTGLPLDTSGNLGTVTSNSERTLGTMASTTGNVYGVYDMSGGAFEYVMGYYTGANSNYASDSDTYFGYNSSSNYAGFSSKPLTKYWDEYTTNTVTTACSEGICYGHALSETSGWYSDSAGFVSSNNPWFVRGGIYFSDAGAGAFGFGSYNGSADYFTFRLVLVANGA